MAETTCLDCNTFQEKPASNDATVKTESNYNPLDASTFTPPTALPGFSVTIEFCDRVSVFHLTYFWSSLKLTEMTVPMVCSQPHKC